VERNRAIRDIVPAPEFNLSHVIDIRAELDPGGIDEPGRHFGDDFGFILCGAASTALVKR
jgi:hypothetical protein